MCCLLGSVNKVPKPSFYYCGYDDCLFSIVWSPTWSECQFGPRLRWMLCAFGACFEVLIPQKECYFVCIECIEQ